MHVNIIHELTEGSKNFINKNAYNLAGSFSVQ